MGQVSHAADSFSHSENNSIFLENLPQYSQNPDIKIYPEEIQVKDLNEISGPQGGEYRHGCLLRSSAALYDHSDDGGSKCLLTVRKLLPDHTRHNAED